MKVKEISRHIIALPPEEGRRKVSMTVTLDAQTGYFFIDVPKPILARMGINHRMCESTLTDLERRIDKMIASYDVAVQLSVAEQVIVVNYRSKRSAHVPSGYTSNFTEFSSDRLPSLVMAFDYEVLLRVGDKLYSQEFEGAPLHFESGAKSTTTRIVLDWSQAAENMFASASEKLQVMIENMDAFLTPEAIAGNIESAVAAKQSLMLDGPDAKEKSLV